MHEACPAIETDCVVLNEVMTHSWTPADFVDDGHFGRAGGERFAGFLTEQIRSTPR
jgi:hypothetical protein